MGCPSEAIKMLKYCIFRRELELISICARLPAYISFFKTPESCAV